MKTDSYLEKIDIVLKKNGVGSFSMHWLANEIGVSKKTLYNHFESEYDMFESLIEMKREEIKRNTFPLFSNFENDSVDIFFQWFLYNRHFIRDYSERLLNSMRDCYVEYYRSFMSMIKKNCDEFVALLVPRGIDDGYFTNNFNIENYASFIFVTLAAQVDGFNLPEKDIEYAKYLLRSISTESGVHRVNAKTR